MLVGSDSAQNTGDYLRVRKRFGVKQNYYTHLCVKFNHFTDKLLAWTDIFWFGAYVRRTLALADQ